MKTAPTLPAMTDEQIGSCVALADRYAAEYRRTHWNTHLARAIIAARDAQWAARHNAWVDSINKAMAAEVDMLQSEIENLHSVMVAAAEEIHEHWQAHCDEEGYGPANLMHRLEKGIPAQYAYKAGDFERLAKERDAAVARIDAAVRDEREVWLARAELAEAEAERLRIALNFIAEHFSSAWPDRCQINVQAARRALRIEPPNAEFSGVPAGHSSNHPAGGTSAATQG